MQISDLIPWGRDKDEAPATGDSRSGNPLVALQRDINRVFENFWQRAGNREKAHTNPVGMFGPNTGISETDDGPVKAA